MKTWSRSAKSYMFAVGVGIAVGIAYDIAIPVAMKRQPTALLLLVPPLALALVGAFAVSGVILCLQNSYLAGNYLGKVYGPLVKYAAYSPESWKSISQGLDAALETSVRLGGFVGGLIAVRRFWAVGLVLGAAPALMATKDAGIVGASALGGLLGICQLGWASGTIGGAFYDSPSEASSRVWRGTILVAAITIVVFLLASHEKVENPFLYAMSAPSAAILAIWFDRQNNDEKRKK